LASDQKDLLISQLKAEIFEIQQRDKDFLAMKDQLMNIQSKYRHLQDEKLLQDNDFRTKHDSNMATLHGLKKEMDDLRFMLNDKNRNNGDLQDQIASLRDQVNRKDMEIAGAKSDSSQKSDQGFSLRKEIDNLEYEVKRLAEEKLKDQDEIGKLEDLNNYRARENGEQQVRIRAIDYDLMKSQDRASELQKISEQKEFELRRVQDKLDEVNHGIGKAKEDNSRHFSDQNALQRQRDRAAEERAALQRQFEQEEMKGRDLTQTTYNLEQKVRDKEEQISMNRRELDDVRFSNQSMNERNRDLTGEVEALQQHIRVLDGQNRDLNGELDQFVQTDEQIRSTLNRRDRVVDLRLRVDGQLQQSYKELERSSPARRARH